jgi:hypothetical protein
MNEVAHVERNSKQPEHQQDHEYCPEHKILSVRVTCSFVRCRSAALMESKISAVPAICSRLRERPWLQSFHYGTQVPVRCFELSTRRIVIALR